MSYSLNLTVFSPFNIDENFFQYYSIYSSNNLVLKGNYLLILVRCCYISAPDCIHLTKGRPPFFLPETIVVSFLHFMVLFLSDIHSYFKTPACGAPLSYFKQDPVLMNYYVQRIINALNLFMHANLYTL